eukprot:768169-Hanusia_phi.AAC.2
MLSDRLTTIIVLEDDPTLIKVSETAGYNCSTSPSRSVCPATHATLARPRARRTAVAFTRETRSVIVDLVGLHDSLEAASHRPGPSLHLACETHDITISLRGRFQGYAHPSPVQA